MLSIAIIAGAIFIKKDSGSNTTSTSSTSEAESKTTKKEELPVYTTDQLAVSNGKNNAPCYVAIEDTVYSIKQGNLWKEGEHTTSEGQAYCGRDLTEALSKSPHGKSKLPELTVVGTYKKD